jgi:hypothetical protein
MAETTSDGSQEGGFFVGLGYHGPAQDPISQHEQAPVFVPSSGSGHTGHHVTPSSYSSTTDATTTEQLMRQYMQQCLDYHAEQQEQKKHDHPEMATALRTHSEYLPPPAPDLRPLHPPAIIQIPGIDSAKIDHNNAVDRALAIAMKLQTPDKTSQNSDCRAKREAFLQTFKQKLHRALVKNLEYVASRDEETLQRQLLELEHQKQAQQNQQQRQRIAAMSKAGIGTNKRRKQQQPNVPQPSTTRLYVTGLPTNEDANALEEILATLFGAHGRIRYINLYRDKRTQRLKGDALVVYDDATNTQTSSNLARHVCSQVSVWKVL